MRKYLFLLSILAFGIQSIAQNSCKDEGFREFDFWIGDWVVYTQDTIVAGYSEVELILDSCVINENWTSARDGYSGKSYNSYNQEDGIWTQTWVDNFGTTIHFFGSYNNGVMHFTARKSNDEAVIDYIMDYTKMPQGNIRQLWKASDDGGKSWTVLFDGLYKPVKN